MHSAAWHDLWGSIEKLAKAAGTIAGEAFVAAFKAELISLPSAIFNAIGGPSSGGTTKSGGRTIAGRNPITGPSIAGNNLAHATAGGTHYHTTVNFNHPVDPRDQAAFRRMAMQIGKSIGHQQTRLAGA